MSARAERGYAGGRVQRRTPGWVSWFLAALVAVLAVPATAGAALAKSPNVCSDTADPSVVGVSSEA